jgi:hypothetical protein
MYRTKTLTAFPPVAPRRHFAGVNQIEVQVS